MTAAAPEDGGGVAVDSTRKAVELQWLVAALERDVPGFDRLLGSHLDCYEELIPHALFGGLVEHVDRRRGGVEADWARARATVAVLERALEAVAHLAADDEWRDYLETLVVTSFIENFEPLDPDVTALFADAGPRFRQLAHEYGNWRTAATDD